MKSLQTIYILLILFLSLAGKSYSKETIHLTSGEWAPYLSEKLKHNGIAGRIL